MLALMDSKVTKAQFEEERKRMKFLHDCKTKGFKNLEKLGQFSGGISQSFRETRHDARKIVGEAFNDANRKQIAEEVAQRVKAGERIGAACERVGVDQMTVRKWADKLGVDIPRLKGVPIRISDKQRCEIIDRVNKDGLRLKEVAIKYKMTLNQLSQRIRTWGYKYDQRNIKLTKINEQK